MVGWPVKIFPPLPPPLSPPSLPLPPLRCPKSRGVRPLDPHLRAEGEAEGGVLL